MTRPMPRRTIRHRGKSMKVGLLPGVWSLLHLVADYTRSAPI